MHGYGVFVEFCLFSMEDDPVAPQTKHKITAWTLGYIIFSISDRWPVSVAN